MFFLKRGVFLRKKAPGRDAPHRSQSWGCTKTPISNKIHKKIKNNQEINAKTAGKKKPLFTSLLNLYGPCILTGR